MRQMSVRELRNSLARIDELLKQEGDIVITRHGRMVAKLIPARKSTPPPSHADLRAAMPRLERPSEELIREDRDRG